MTQKRIGLHVPSGDDEWGVILSTGVIQRFDMVRPLLNGWSHPGIALFSHRPCYKYVASAGGDVLVKSPAGVEIHHALEKAGCKWVPTTY